MKMQILFTDHTQEIVEVDNFELMQNCLVLHMKESTSYLPINNIRRFSPGANATINSAKEKTVIK